MKNMNNFLSNELYSIFLWQKLMKICLHKVNPSKNNDFTEGFWGVYGILAKYGNLHFWNVPIFEKYSSGGLIIFFLQVECTFKLPKKILEHLNKNFWFYLRKKGGGVGLQ